MNRCQWYKQNLKQKFINSPKKKQQKNMTTASHRKPTIAAPLILEFSLIFLSCNKNKKSWRSNGGKIRKISSSTNTPSHRRTRHRHRFTHPPLGTHRRCRTKAAPLIRRDSRRSVRHQSHHYQATTSSIATNTNNKKRPGCERARNGTHPDSLNTLSRIQNQTLEHLSHSLTLLLMINAFFFYYCVC